MKSKIEPSQYNVQKDEKIMIGNYAMEWGKNTRKKKKRFNQRVEHLLLLIMYKEEA